MFSTSENKTERMSGWLGSCQLVLATSIFLILLFGVKLLQARMKIRRLQSKGIPIMTHSLLFGHLPVVLQFYRDWAFDANFIQTFGYYMSKNWKRFFPNQKQCPPVVYVDVWPISTPMVFTMKAYISNQMEIGNSLPKSPMQGQFLDPISKGRDLNCMHGEEWRTWRSRFNPGFSQASIRHWIPSILEEAVSFANSLQSLSGGNGDWGHVFPFEKICADLAFDAAGRVILDTRLHCQSPHPSPFGIAYREQLNRMEITLSPWKLMWRSTPLFKLMVWYKRKELYRFIRPFIVESFSGTTTERKSIVQAGVEEYNREGSSSGHDAKGIPDESFIDSVYCQLMIFFFGGDDAIALTIPRIFKNLQLHPECLAKLRQEHDEVLGPDSSIAAKKILESPHLLDSLQYTTGVIKETLRIDPATITIRQGQPDFNFQVQGDNIPWPTDGFDLFDSSITIHRDPENFPDPLEFIPDRFTVSKDHVLYPGKNIWRGFQLGPRKCIGQEMAMVVLKLTLVMVVRDFDIEIAWDEWDKFQKQRGSKIDRRTVEGNRMYTTGKATSHNKDGAPVRVKKRTISCK